MTPQQITYSFRKNARAKRLRATVYHDGRVVVTAPDRVSLSTVERFLAEKQRWILEKLQFFRSIERQGVRVFSKEDYHNNKKAALQLAQEKVASYAQIYGFQWNRISIKNQKTRWGSCSRRRNLSFNYRILFLPEELQNYLVVHELCHLQEMNHSPRFWHLVAKTLPNYADLRKKLRKSGVFYR